MFMGGAFYGKIWNMLKSKKPTTSYFPKQKEKKLQFATNNPDTSISTFSE